MGTGTRNFKDQIPNRKRKFLHIKTYKVINKCKHQFPDCSKEINNKCKTCPYYKK